MNLLGTLLTIAVLLISKAYTFPTGFTDEFELTTDIFDVTSADTVETTTSTIMTTTTTTAVTTTTTLPPEVDREWEDLVLAGPTVVNYLSLFMVLASRNDVALNVSDEYTVKYIKNVESLRATLSQISLEMQTAFQVAREDLTRTRVSMEQIPEHIKAGLLLIKSAPNELLKKLLPYTLRNVDRAASEGSAVAKPTLERFVSVGSLLEELVTLLAFSSLSEEDDYLIEANAYAKDLKTQWDLLVNLFKKFSDRADITQQSIIDSFRDPTDEAQKAGELNTEIQRTAHLDSLIPVTLAIDQSAHLLNMMSSTYTEVSNDHMVNQIVANKVYLGLQVENARATSQRQLWQNTVSQSVKVARLAQQRHNQFAESSSIREQEYSDYLKDMSVA